jgi:hypothetical protein
MILVSIRPLLSRPLRRQIVAGNMLRAGEQIDADIVGHFRICEAVKGGMGKGCGATAAPVLAGRVRVKNLWTLVRRELHQNPISLARHRIELIEIEIRKQRCDEEAEPVWPRKARVKVGTAGRARDI